MSNELDDFLRHTAEIRQRKTIEQRSDAAIQRESRVRPQYSDARREREVGASRFDIEEMTADELELSDDAIMAIEVEPQESDRLRSMDAKIPEHVHREHTNPDENDGGHSPARPTETTIDDLRSMLKSPAGIRQAFLLREIFDRRKF